MRNLSRRPFLPAMRVGLVTWLVALLLASQSLGLWHRTWHAPWAASHQSAEAAEHAHDHPGVSAFGHDAEQTEQCRLYDQLALADSLLVAALALLLEPARLEALETRAAGAARCSEPPYEARAPPLRP